MQPLGRPLTGTQLPTVPPNATEDQKLAVINEIVGILNNYSRDVVQTDTVDFAFEGANAQTVLTIPHNLGYTPRAEVYLNDVTLTVGDFIYPGVNIPLPTYLNAANIGVGGGGGQPAVIFFDWLDFFVDENNLYIHFTNADGVTGSVPLTYSLTRLPSNTSQ